MYRMADSTMCHFYCIMSDCFAVMAVILFLIFATVITCLGIGYLTSSGLGNLPHS